MKKFLLAAAIMTIIIICAVLIVPINNPFEFMLGFIVGTLSQILYDVMREKL